MAHPYLPGQKALQLLMAPIVRWCVRIGVGHGQFIRIVKPLFYEAALEEIKRNGLKCSDSAISLASGLHKGDITLFHQSADAGVPEPINDYAAHIERINPASQVIARWIALRLPNKVPIRGSMASFDGLVKACQQAGAPFLSTKLILQDLTRRRLVEVLNDEVHLLSEIGIPDIDGEDAVVHFVGAVRDHIEACLANLEPGKTPKYLEESLQADGLYPKSATTLSALARQWWLKALQSITAQAIALSEKDEPDGGNQRVRFGVYFYTHPMTTEAPSTHTPQSLQD
jgi:hypothetical protein